MGGFSSVTGDETIMFADNASFDGTQRGGKMTTNGQLWIGSTAARHIKLGTLTSPSGTIAIGYSSPNITLDTVPTALNYTNVTKAMSPYTVLSTDYYISVDCSGGAVQLTFPNSPTFKQTWIIKDRTGNAAVSNITLTTPGGVVTFDGLTTYTMNSNFQAINLLANGAITYEVY